jgi:hypothetical protein
MIAKRNKKSHAAFFLTQEISNETQANLPWKRWCTLGDFDAAPVLVEFPRTFKVPLDLGPEKVEAAQGISNCT